MVMGLGTLGSQIIGLWSRRWEGNPGPRGYIHLAQLTPYIMRRAKPQESQNNNLYSMGLRTQGPLGLT